MVNARTKNVLNILIVLVISFGFVAWQFRKVDFSAFVKSLRNINYWWLLIAFILMFLYWLFEAIVLHMAAKPANQKQHFRSSFRITMIGQFFNTITPMSTGGQPAQLVMLMKQGMDAGKASSVLLIKFIIYQAMIVFNFLIVLIFGLHYLLNGVPQLKYLVFIGFLVHLAVITALLLIAKSTFLTKRIVHLLLIPARLFIKKERHEQLRFALDERITSFHQETNRIGADKWLLVKACVMTSLQLWVFFAIPYFVLLSLHVGTIGFFVAMTYHAFIIMFATVMPTPGGAGGAEYTFMLLFGALLVPAEALAAMILWRIVTYYSCIIFGGAALLISDETSKQLRSNFNDIKDDL
ncbi:Uncharacterised protein family (UPF0104) [Listeria grayi]|uniref:lysylphosphatidylglycerol synthase transmembrane domain-containing protein n=1 Tax=Listeria grayi TaxID=1641 RepID=UPI00055A415A|nr:Uncharacterised protein family (UPF0104) [Listeria grayi]